MSYYERLIDGTDFGLVAGYLKSQKSPIEALLHVKDRTLLANLAEELRREIDGGIKPGQLPEVMLKMLKEGLLKVSVRPDIKSWDPKSAIDPATVPRSARCDVIYFPPFYLVHTPGLFDGKSLSLPTSKEEKPLEAISPALEHLRKITGPRHGL